MDTSLADKELNESLANRDKKALVAIRKLRAKLQQLEYKQHEPIAIVGLSCRFPQAPNADEYWQLLDAGMDAIREVPAERWDIDAYYDPDPDAPGKVYSRRAGYLDDIDAFDAAFFGVSPREAEFMDPQQRLLLEQAWHALEHAGIAPRDLYGTRTGVFVGITASDYAMLILEAGIDIGPYYVTGNTLNVASGRLAYVLRLQGPALAIDTACSSSLVAVHQACQSLRNGESELALAAGVNLLISPQSTIATCRAHMMSPDGRCKTFDVSADGYVRGEGCGVLVLKRLSDAQRSRDRILALIRGSAVNHDGRSSGLTVPNGPAQERVIADALRAAGLKGSDVHYLEAHGTGTSLGDPIEVQAAARALAADREGKAPLLVGSTKTNIGHLESAAGIAGIIKVVLSMQHERIPKSLHFQTPNPHIPWEQLNIEVAADAQTWPRGQERRIADVSAFGFSGTNAHVVLEEAPVQEAAAVSEQTQPDRSEHILAISARTEAALTAMAGRYCDYLARNNEISLPDLCHTANTGRDHFEERAALVFESREQLHEQLAELQKTQIAPGVVRGRVALRGERHTAFLFTGQGSQFVGMGRQLYAIEPVFRAHFDRCAELFGQLRSDAPGLREILFEDDETGRLDQTGYTQPALYALEVSALALWRDWAVEPTVVLGHSVGEYAAAYAAGVFSLEDGMKLITERGRLMQSLPSGGAMATVSAAAETIEKALQDCTDVCIGAYNGADTVISGSQEQVDALIQRFESEGLRCKRLVTSHAFHSARMDPILDEFRAFASGMTYRRADKRLISNVSGEAIEEDRVLDADYWTNHLRQPVQFERSIRTLAELGCDTMLEIGPHPVLTGMGQRCWDAEQKPLWAATLRRGRSDTQQLLTAAAVLHTGGVELDFDAIDAPWQAARRKVALPLYPFQRQRYWVEVPDSLGVPSGLKLKDCVYRTVWERKDCPAQPSLDEVSASWLILCDEGAMGTALSQQLEQRGHRCVCLDAQSHQDVTAETLAERIGEAEEEAGPIRYVLHLGSLDSNQVDSLEDLHRAQACGVESVLRLVQALLQRSWKGQLWLVTRGVQHVIESDGVQPAHSPVWGMGKVIGLEQPSLWGGLCDLPVDADATSLTPQLIAACESGDAEDLVALRDEGRWVARLVKAEPLPPAHLQLEEDATYLITGGLGDIGLNVARRLVERGARHLVLSSRKAPSEAAKAMLQQIRAQGCTVTVLLADVSREDELSRLFDEMEQRELPRLRGVIHAAGVTSVRPLERVDRDDLYATMAAKVFGAWLLDRIVSERGMDLAFFVCTSSIAAVWGSALQASYAAGNAFLDALCKHRVLQGRVATAICYGPWQQAGIGMSTEESLELLSKRGIHALSAALALDGMEALMSAGVSGSAIAHMDWSKFRVLAEAQRPRPLMGRLGQSPTRDIAAPADGQPSAALERLRKTPESDRVRAIADLVRKEFADVLKMPLEDLTDDVSYFSLGIDSLMAVEAVDRLERQLAGIGVSVPLVYEHPSIMQLATALAPRVGSTETTAGGEAPIAARPDEYTASIVDKPASVSQKRIWFLQQWAPASAQFNLPIAIRFRNGIELGLLQRILSELLRRHDSLCTTLHSVDSVDNEVRQVVQRRMVPLLAMFDLSNGPDAEPRLRELMRSEARKGFDLANNPMIRVSLVSMGASDQVLLVTMHHAISDGVSNRVLIEEFLALYEAFAKGEPSPLAEPQAQFWSYAAAEEARLARPETKIDEAYWRQELANLPPLELPCDHLRPAVQTHRGEHVRLSLSSDLRDTVYRFSREAGVTPFETLLATWAVLLGRYSGQGDFGIGAPVAGRDGSQWRRVIGLFLNMLTLRVRMQQEWTVRDLLAHVHEVAGRAYAHQALPFDRLVQRINPPRDPSRSPLFQTTLTLQVTRQDLKERMGVTGVEVEDLRPYLGASQCDIALDLEETSSGMQGFIEYNADLFDRWRIEQMAAHFENLLQSLTANPDTRISTLSMLLAGERPQLLAGWNATERNYPQGQCIHQLFETQVKKSPKTTAVVFEDQALTYRELDARANQLAHYLRSLSIGPDALVGICVERSLEMVVGLLGILKAGAAYVPLDPDYPKERLAFMLGDAGVSVVLTQGSLRETLPAGDFTTLSLDEDWQRQVAKAPKSSPQNEATPGNLAYVIFTSGSTGKPKGVAIEHAAIVNRLHWMQEAYGLDESDRILQKTAFSFDVSVWEFFWPLITGARLVLAQPGGHKDSAYLADLIAKEHITTVHFVPPMLAVFLQEPGVEACNTLRRVICSGEALPAELVRQHYARLGAPLHNLYGPTEAAVDVTYWPCERNTELAIVPIGRPVANTQMYILDAELNPVPVGVSGELFIGGVQLARGYINRPDLTAEKFIPNPFSDAPGKRLYRTGDLARYRPDGNIEFLGRIDHQVKIRGFRIELGEIEATLALHPAVKESVALAREDAPGDKRLVAYLVTTPGSEPQVSELRAYLKEKLPEYMVPSAFVLLDALPLTTNGKVDRRALPAPQVSTKRAQGFVAPRTPTEERLAGIWSEVLGIQRIGVRDNFFELGGHSLLIVQLMSKVRQHDDFEVSVVDLYQRPTVEVLAAYLDSRAGTTGQIATSGIGETAPFEPTFRDVQPASSDGVHAADPCALPHDSKAWTGEVHHQLNDGLRYTYRRYRDGDKAPAIAALRESYGHDFSRNAERTFDWKYLENPLIPADGPIVDILECDDKIVGMNGRIPVRFKIGEDETSGVWNGDTHVVPDHRTASGWFAYQANKVAPAVSFGMPNPNNYAILSAANAVIDVARFTNLKACLDLGPVLEAKGVNAWLSSLCGMAFSAVPRSVDILSKLRIENDISVREIPRFDSRLDELWQAVSQDISGVMVRDEKFLSWRFDRCPNRDYTRYVAERNGKIVGYMVSREFRWGGIGRGRIVDYLVRPDDTSALNSLLQKVVWDFKSRGVVSIICSVYTTRKNQIREFQKHGFLYSQPGSQICVDRSSLQQSLSAIKDWFFTYADGDIDYCDDYSEFEDTAGGGSL